MTHPGSGSRAGIPTACTEILQAAARVPFYAELAPAVREQLSQGLAGNQGVASRPGDRWCGTRIPDETRDQLAVKFTALLHISTNGNGGCLWLRRPVSWDMVAFGPSHGRGIAFALRL